MCLRVILLVTFLITGASFCPTAGSTACGAAEGSLAVEPPSHSNASDTFATAWWLGGDRRSFTFCGIPVLWLGRIGKVLRFIVSCVIIIEIIGLTTVKQWGLWLRNVSLVRGPWNIVKSFFRFVVVINKLTYQNLPPQQQKALDTEYGRFMKSPLHLVILTLLCGFGIMYLARIGPITWWSPVLVFFASLILAPLVLLLVSLSLTAVCLLLQFIVFMPTAWILGSENVNRRVKMCSLILLIVGFCLEALVF